MEGLFSVFFLFLMASPLLEGHICLISPRQRGDFNISLPGSRSCYRRTYYCGGETEGVRTPYFAGQEAAVHMQQNLNHFWFQKPGYLELLFSSVPNPAETDWVSLDMWDDWPANDMISQVNFTRIVTFPNVPCDECILGARYVSFNQDEISPKNNTDAIFYNCANIQLVAPPSSLDVAQLKPLEDNNDEELDSSSSSSSFQKEEDLSCCTPSQWQGSAVSTTGTGESIIQVYYDGEKQVTRWDRSGMLEPDMGYQDYTFITNYFSGPPYLEYLINNIDDTCIVFAADRFYDWCYGKDRGMPLSSSYSVGDQDYWRWTNPTNKFSFSVTAKDCYPHTIHHGQFSLSFDNVVPEITNSSIFDLPSFCWTAKVVDVCGEKY